MPKVRIDIVKGKSAEWKQSLQDAIHLALVEEIHIPQDDRMQILQEHAAENFSMPGSKGLNYINVDIVMYPGRSRELRGNLLARLTKEFTGLGIAAEEIMITLHEPPRENWSV